MTSDLGDEFEAVKRALNAAGLLAYRRDWVPGESVNVRFLPETTVFVAIIGERESNLLISEYDEAVRLGLPRLIFMREHRISSEAGTQDVVPSAFRERLRRSDLVSYFATLEELELNVTRAVRNLLAAKSPQSFSSIFEPFLKENESEENT